MGASYPQQGQVYLIKALRSLGDTKKRPAVVVSMDLRNELSRTLLVVPFTSDISSGETPTRILVPVGKVPIAGRCDRRGGAGTPAAIRAVH